jgi:hypothetical protein
MAEEIANLPAAEASNTEVLRLVRQRVGQQTYRQAMLNGSMFPRESLDHLGLLHSMRLRWVAAEHHRYLQFHRSNFVS